jgi:predicted dehydrogenase
MRIALVGNHPDGMEMASALTASGRHSIAAHTGGVDADLAQGWGARRVVDLEELLADPGIGAVLIAGELSARPLQLRRALQSERHVLCVHPPDQTPEAAYEAALIQKDTGCVLLPLLPEGLHPAVRRLAELIVGPPGVPAGEVPVGALQLLQFERSSTGEVLDGADIPGQKPSLPGWDVLRALGGEVAEVSGFAPRERLEAGQPLLLAGRFEKGGLFQVTLLPHQPAPHWRLTALGTNGRAELLFPLGWDGPAFLEWRDQEGEPHEEHWERGDPWPVLVQAFEDALSPGEKGRPLVSWQDAVRALELDDAARRSVERRRTSLLEYPEASEEVGFKGTMTLAGCALLWAVLLLLIASRWVPRVGWLILPLLVIFVVLQLLRYAIPPRQDTPQGPH